MESSGRTAAHRPEGEAVDLLDDLGAFIRQQRTAAQISLRGLADKAGVSNPYLSQVERGLRRPSADILAQIAKGLSISVESLLTRAGVLDAAPDNAVLDAIRADRDLTERQKESLAEVYRSMVAGNPPRPVDQADADPVGGDEPTTEANGPTAPAAHP